jgi:hypothetical protein
VRTATTTGLKVHAFRGGAGFSCHSVSKLCPKAKSRRIIGKKYSKYRILSETADFSH